MIKGIEAKDKMPARAINRLCVISVKFYSKESKSQVNALAGGVGGVGGNTPYANADAIKASIFSGVSVGAKRLSTLPSFETRNFVKFHFIFDEQKPRFLLLR